MRCQPRDKHQVYIWLKSNQPCLLCDESTGTPQAICTPCESELPWLGDHCLRCALPLAMAGLTCGQCLKRPPAFQQVVAPWAYGFPVDSLVSRFKHQANWPYGRMMAELLSQLLRYRFDEGLPRPDLLLPVPLAAQRLRERGFNQSALLARWLSERLHIPEQPHWLLRPLETPTQQGLSAKARQRNLRRAFALAPEAQVHGRHLALVDDVLTTGATAHNLARLLRAGGAARVDVYCLARTPKPEGPR